MSIKVIPNELFFLNVENIINSGKSVELKVKGSSMSPTLVSGKHKVVLSPFDKRYLRLGLIALILYNNKHVLHRLVAIDSEVLTFQGDNRPNTTEVVNVEDVRAFVEYIITPRGRVVDCKKWRCRLMSRWFVSINKWRFTYLRLKIKIAKKYSR